MKKPFKLYKTIIIITLLSLSLFIISCSETNPPIDEADVHWEFYNERAEYFVTAMSTGDFGTARDMFDRTMKLVVSKSRLENEIWNAIIEQAGEFISIHEIENLVYDGYLICFVTSQHENTGVTLRVVFSQNGLISGLFIEGYTPIAGELTEITQRDGFTDYPVIIGEGTDFPLNGILSMPDNVTDKVPAAVIVHGSGPGDMDGTIFTNKPHRDIAEYLASNGIAVIRYNKRTLSHGTKIDGSWTVREETIEDAILATEILKADTRIDENRVFIIGHSLGGMLAPRIHDEGGNYAGLILLAGSPRFLLDISKTQNIATVESMEDGKEKEAALDSIEQWDEHYNAFLTLPDDEAVSTTVPGWGVSAYYFKDLYENPISTYIEKATIPFLVLQGSNDFQVLAEIDFILYKELLAGRSNVTFKLYDGLNHLFMPSSKTNISELMDEYAIESRVDPQVLADIVEWIRQH